MNTTGDLEFLINITRSGVGSVEVYIPPEFKVFPGNPTNVWTNATNNYRFIAFGKVTQRDVGYGLAPGWWTARVRSPTEIAPINSKVIVRIFNVTSPIILGRYFFKVTLDGLPIKATEFPQIIVKGDINPATISGTVRIGGLNTTLYGQPISVAMPEGCGGRVVAFGRDIRNRLTSAQAYFNKTANGQYTLFGLSPGTYNLTAEACGFPPQPLGKAVSVLPTQFVDGVDFFLFPGPAIRGTVFSKCINNLIPWGRAFPISPVAPFNRFAQNRTFAVDLLDANTGALIATNSPYIQTAPRQFVSADSNSFSFRLREHVGYSGHIPQAFANFTSGIPPGDYQLRVYVQGYVQLREVKIRVPSNVGFGFIPIDVIIREIDLWRSNPIVATIHFKNQTGIFKTTPTTRPLALVLIATDEAGALKGWNVTVLPTGTTSTTLSIEGFQGLFPFRGIRDQGMLPRSYLIKAYVSGWLEPEIPLATIDICTSEVRPTFLSFDLFRGGILNLTVISVNATSGVFPTIPVNWAYPRANMTLQVFDTAGRDFGFNRSFQPAGTPFFRVIFDGMDFFQLVFRSNLFPYIFGALDQALDTGTYVFRIRTLGYLDSGPYTIQLQPGRIADFSFKMIIGPILEVNVNFQTENVFAPVGSSTRDYLLRIASRGVDPVAVAYDNGAATGLADRILVLDSNAGTGGRGALFTVSPSTGIRTLISDFGNINQGPLGADPISLAIEPSGNVLVLDQNAGDPSFRASSCPSKSPGTGCGAVFRLIKANNFQRVLIHDLGDPTQRDPFQPSAIMAINFGVNPSGLALDASGNIRVVDTDAGDPGLRATNCPSKSAGIGCGAVFRLSPSGATFTRSLIHDFGGGACPCGVLPAAIAVDASGNSIVVDQSAGTSAKGALFRITVDGMTRTQIHDFGTGGTCPNPPNCGVDPVDVAIDPSGNFAVVDANAGSRSRGVVFRITADGVTRTIINEMGAGTACDLGLLNCGRDPVGLAIVSSSPQPPLQVGEILVIDLSAGTVGPICFRTGCGALFRLDGAFVRSIISDFGEPIQDGLFPGRATSLRVEVYDRTGKFIAANISLIQVTAFRAKIEVIGFDSYAGSLPSVRWYNFFDSTNGAFQLDAGIAPGSYVVRVVVPRYWQSEPVPVSVQLGGRTTVSITLQRFGHIFGFVRGPDIFKTLIPLSWATVGPSIPVIREVLVAPSLEGFYELWLPAGDHIIGAQYPGYSPNTVRIALTWGAEQGLNFFMALGAPRPSATVEELTSPQLSLVASVVVAFLLLVRLKPRVRA